MSKEIKDFTLGDYAAFGMLTAVMVAAIVFIGLALSGVIPGATATDAPASIPTATAVPTPSPTPAPELLGSEDRKACGYLFTSYEWAVKQRENRYENRYWFTNNLTMVAGVMTLSDGCYLEEKGLSIIRGDRHKPFDVTQFRLGEFGENKNDLKLHHAGIRVDSNKLAEKQ